MTIKPDIQLTPLDDDALEALAEFLLEEFDDEELAAALLPLLVPPLN